MNPNPKWIDLTHEISPISMPYPGDPHLEIKFLNDSSDVPYTLSEVKSGMHLGTHVDSPLHFIKGGKTITDLPLEHWSGKANVIHVAPQNGLIDTLSIETAYRSCQEKQSILLIETGHDKWWNQETYYTNCPMFEKSIFAFLRENQIRLIGVDMPTMHYKHHDAIGMHRDLLGNQILIIENMTNLRLLSDTVYLMALPLKINGLEASLVRAVACEFLGK